MVTASNEGPSDLKGAEPLSVSETVPGESPDELGHRKRRSPSEVLQDDYDRVAAACDGFRDRPLDGLDYSNRGGNVVEGRESRRDMDGPVEMSFTPDQQEYVQATVSAMNSLLHGRTLPDGKPGPEVSFAERIKQDFLNQEPTAASFDAAVYRSLLGTLRDLCDQYPNMGPAFKMFFCDQKAGAAGMHEAFVRSKGLLEVALEGGVDARGATDHSRSLHSLENFSLDHHVDRRCVYEVWCPAESAARSVIVQAGKAAYSLSTIPRVVATYDTQNDPLSKYFDDLPQQLRSLVAGATAVPS
jgi:hypothetical protein